MAAPGRASDRAASRDLRALAGTARTAALAAPTLLALLRGRRGRALLSALAAGSSEALPAQLLRAPLARHPMAPAALRIERSRSRGQVTGDQVAVTVWFGEGPALPAPGGQSGAGRVALRVGASLLGAAAVAAATAAAARLAEPERPRIVEGTVTPADGPDGRPAAEPADGGEGDGPSPHGG